MTTIRNRMIWLRLFIRKLPRKFSINLTWRMYALIVFVTLSVFSASVIALEVLPSHWLIKTTFVASLETQNLSFRTGSQTSNISGISGSDIVLRETSTPSLEALNLMQIDENVDNESKTTKSYFKLGKDSHLELDNFLIPAQRAVEISTNGRGKFMSLQVPDDKVGTLVETTVVWRGGINVDAASRSTQIGSDRWEALSPLVEIQSPEIDGLIYSPIAISAISTERLRLSGSSQIATSSLLQGSIQFYLNFPFGSYPTEPIKFGSGEFTQFNGLEAQITNLELTETGLQFLLVGKAAAVEIGFLNSRRNIMPSMLDGLRSIESLMIILSSVFALLLASLSAISLGKDKRER